jgi:hypothetical protein
VRCYKVAWATIGDAGWEGLMTALLVGLTAVVWIVRRILPVAIVKARCYWNFRDSTLENARVYVVEFKFW